MFLGMDLNITKTINSSSSSTFYCPYAPHVSWENEGSAFYLVKGLMTVMASLPTILLNTFVILAIKQRRELQKPSNIMLSSLAVKDLLVGVIVMPIYATIDFFTIHQVSLEHICMLYGVMTFFMPLVSTATLHHLTIIAWERYVAVHKWMDYKRVITNGRIKKIAIGAWLCALLPSVAIFISTVVLGHRTVFEGILTGWTTVETVCLFFVAFFYRKVYLGIRNRKLGEISQIDVLIKAKLESKVAKTTGMLTAAVISSFIPIFIFAILGNVVPVFRTTVAIRFTQLLSHMNSLFNPLLYCYRDQRFRKAIRELLCLKNPRTQIGAGQFFRRKHLFKSSEMRTVGKRTQRLTRSSSCNLADALDSINGTTSVVMLKKTLSAPTLDAAAAP